MTACPRCPCPTACTGAPAYCLWAAEDPPDLVKLRHICDASGRDPATFPPLAIQAGNLSRALWDWAVSGFSMASDEEQERREIICLNCDQWKNGRCKLCGCYTSAKIRLRTEHCPIAKW